MSECTYKDCKKRIDGQFSSCCFDCSRQYKDMYEQEKPKYKYRVEKRIMGEVVYFKETNDFGVAQNEYRANDDARNSIGGDFIQSATLLYINDKCLKFLEAERLIYTVKERQFNLDIKKRGD